MEIMGEPPPLVRVSRELVVIHPDQANSAVAL